MSRVARRVAQGQLYIRMRPEEPNRVHISETTYWRLRKNFDTEPRGRMEFKGVGQTETYFLLARK
jgi:hypothetical protein